MQIIDCIWKKNNCMSISDRKYNVEIKVNLAFKCLLLIVYKLVVEGICLPLCLYLHHLPFDEENDGFMGWVLSLLLWTPGHHLVSMSLIAWAFPFLFVLFHIQRGTLLEKMGGLAMVTTRGTPPPWNFKIKN